MWHTKAPMRKDDFCKECDGYRKGCCHRDCFWIMPKSQSGKRKEIFWDYVFHCGDYHLGFDPKNSHSLTLEGQVVALADEIAQRSHDIDDAIASGMLQFGELMDLSQIRSIRELHRALADIDRRIYERQEEGALFVNLERLQKARASSAIVNYLVQSALNGTEITGGDLEEDEHGFGFVAQKKLIKLDEDGENICDYLERVVTSRVLNSSEVSRFDNKGRIVVEGLFEAYYRQPLMLPKNILRRMAVLERSNGYLAAIDLSNCNSDVARAEIESIQSASIFKAGERDTSEGCRTEEGERGQKKLLLVRGIVDYIAGMTDTFATQEYERIYGAAL